jgi:hypothetical protein
MLGVDDATEVNHRRWLALADRTQLPCSWRKFVTNVGAGRVCPESRRRYQRAPLRVQAILRTGGAEYAGYAKDISRLGVGLFSPVPILPKQAVELELLSGKKLLLRVARCRRVGPQCFECGSIFEQPEVKRRPQPVFN